MSMDLGGSSTNTPSTRRRKQPQHRSVFKYVGPDLPEPTNYTLITSDQLIHNGLCYRLGDVVRVFSKSNKIYFGIIVYLWSDQFTEKYVTLQWLIPKEDISNDGHRFYPHKYSQGPVHPDRINVRSVGFVMSAKSFGADFDSPVFNRYGELAIIFNSNLPAS